MLQPRAVDPSTPKQAQAMRAAPVAGAIIAQVAKDAAALAAAAGRAPTLRVVQVGADPASTAYIGMKTRQASRAGVRSAVIGLPATIDMAGVRACLAQLNDDPAIDAVLVQLPLPPHLCAAQVATYIDPSKDVDGLHPLNRGLLMAGLPAVEPCTPAGICRLLQAYEVPLRGRRAVVVGRSAIVGRPMAAMLLRHDATVVHCHRHSRDLAQEVRRAEILVTAVGQPYLVPGEWIQEQAVVVDVGMVRTAAGWRGDVEPIEAARRARLLTPVPGGVGPMTVAMLLHNSLQLAERRAGGPPSAP